MSVEFSGQITRSGARREPPLTCAANCSVAAAWFSVTIVSWTCFANVPARGTLPCTAATSAAGLEAPHWPAGRAAPARARPTAAARASAGTTRRPTAADTPGGAAAGAAAARCAADHGAARRRGIHRRVTEREATDRGAWRWASSSQASVVPASATRNVSSGGPPYATHLTVGAWAWLMDSLPQGKAYGHRSRKASTATHQHATATGQARRRSISRWPIANIAKITASATAREPQAYQATLISQDRSGTKNASPNPSPTANEPRRLRRQSETTSRPGPTAASGQKPTGGNAAASARPPAIATSIAGSSGRPPRASGRPVSGAAAAGSAGSEGAAGSRGEAASAAWAPGCGAAAGAGPGARRTAAGSTAEPAAWPPAPACGTVLSARGIAPPARVLAL